jgi:hypothetical protein
MLGKRSPSCHQSFLFMSLAVASQPTMSIQVSILNIFKSHLSSGVMKDVPHDVLYKHMCGFINR